MLQRYQLFAISCLLTSVFMSQVPEYAHASATSKAAQKSVCAELGLNLRTPVKTTTQYTKENPASLQPVLRWKRYPGAPAYEVQVKVQDKILFTDRAIYINGYNFALPADFKGNSFLWRVRALDINRKPLNEYTDWEQVYVDPQLPVDPRPVPNMQFNKINGANLLYPVYNWIPVHGISHYETEVLNAIPTDNTTSAPAEMLVERGYSTGFDWYDDNKHFGFKPFYWRTRGVTEDGKPLTNFSDPQEFNTNPSKNYKFATIGDSISHGGGSLSYSPSDWEYSYQCYLDFDSINLSESGDTSASTLARFDADVLPFHPEYLLIMTGSNSLRGWTPAEDVIHDLLQIKRKCALHGIEPIFLTLPPINPANIKRAFNEPTCQNWRAEFAATNEWIRKQKHVDFGAYFDENELLPTAMGLDGLHLDAPAKKLMAKAINEQLPKLIGK